VLLNSFPATLQRREEGCTKYAKGLTSLNTLLLLNPQLQVQGQEEGLHQVREAAPHCTHNAAAAAAFKSHHFRYKAKKKAFTKYVKKYTDGKKEIESELAQLKKHCSVIRVLAHTQVRSNDKTQPFGCGGFAQQKRHCAAI
jgi:hypothetical protein